MASELLTEVEAAERIGIEPRTLAYLRHRGQGPAFVRFGSQIHRYYPDDVDAWLEASRVVAER